MNVVVAANTMNTETRTFTCADEKTTLGVDPECLVVANHQMNHAAEGMQNNMPSYGRLLARMATPNPSTTPFHAVARLEMRPRAPNTTAPQMAAAPPHQ